MGNGTKPGSGKLRKQPLTPQQMAAHEVDQRIISPGQALRRKDNLYLLACTSTWADDFWHRDSNRDVARFWGTFKRKCGQCGRAVPLDYLCEDGSCIDCHIKPRPPKAEGTEWQYAGTRPVIVAELANTHTVIAEPAINDDEDDLQEAELAKLQAAALQAEPVESTA